MNFPKTLILDVTQEDIEKARRQDSRGFLSYCPIERAALRVLTEVSRVAVTQDGLASLWPAAYYRMSERGAKFIAAFDDDQPVSPTRFRLRRVE